MKIVIVRRVLGAGFGLLLVAGCNDNQPTMPLPTDQIPLAVGNMWQYTENAADTVVAIEDVGGHRYFSVKGDALGEVGVRMDDQGKFHVREVNGAQEGLLFDFNAGVGESWEFKTDPGVDPPSVTLVGKDDTVTVPAGTYSGCYTFFVNASRSVEDDVTYTVAPGTGIVRVLRHSGMVLGLVSFTESR